MERFDLSKNKYYVILGVICFVFILAICNAFNYLPASVTESPRTSEEMALPDGDEVNSENADADDETAENEEDEESEDEESIDGNRNVPPEQISNENEESSDKYQKLLSDGEKYFNDGDYLKSAEAYINASALTSESKDKAICYEKVSKSYAASKRYGTALSFAQKAYNIYPTTEREVLLARIYYKTGDYNKANERMNNVLKRDFTNDR